MVLKYLIIYYCLFQLFYSFNFAIPTKFGCFIYSSFYDFFIGIIHNFNRNFSWCNKCFYSRCISVASNITSTTFLVYSNCLSRIYSSFLSSKVFKDKSNVSFRKNLSEYDMFGVNFQNLLYFCP